MNLGEMVGALVAVFVLGYPAFHFLVRGLAAGPRSRRLANLALFCGLTFLFMPESMLGPTTADRSALFLASGTIRVASGLVGLLLAFMAFMNRRDGGVGLARPITAGGFSLVHLLFGAGVFVTGYFTRPATPWVYESPDKAFRLTLPSPHWRQSPTTGDADVVDFVHPFRPRMQARVLAKKRQPTKVALEQPGENLLLPLQDWLDRRWQQTSGDFDPAAEAYRLYVQKDAQSRAQANYRHGTNAAGNTYSWSTFMDSTPEGEPVFVAQSFVWCPKKQLLIGVIFEGLPAWRGQVLQAMERHAFEKCANTLCLSVE